MWTLWRGFVLQLAEARQSAMLVVAGLIQPFAFASLMLYARAAPDPAYAGRVLAAAAMMSLWSLTLFSAGTALLRDRMGGTLATILVRPAALAEALLGRSLAVALLATATGTLTVSVAAATLGSAPALPGPATTLVLATLAIASAACLGMLLCAVVLVARGAPRMIEALLYLVFVLGGLLVPVDLLPAPLRLPAATVSLHHIVEMVGRRRADPGGVLAVVGLSALYLALSLRLMWTVLRRARERGSLELA